jgi:Delta14-sterol reductase
MAILAVALGGTLRQGANFVLWTYIDENYLHIVTANILVAFALATYVYVHSFGYKPGNTENRELAAGGHTGNMIYDWFIGRELNPRVTIPLLGEVDVKEFCELRPGLLGWSLVNFAWAARQYRNYGYVTDSMVFITGVQFLYIADGWYNEAAVLTTMDLTTDGFGFMLAFGDLGWLPFVYTTTARYLSIYPHSLGPLGTAGLVAMLTAGLYIFRSSNSQKDTFRRNPSHPSVAHLECIQTKSGSKLLVSGWWGVARHINYLGDWLQAASYCLPSGMAGYLVAAAGSEAGSAEGAFKMADGRVVVPGVAQGWGMVFTYFYVVYMGVLLVHRDLRDDEMCFLKYGDDWLEYKRRVKYRVIPGIY